MTSSNAFIETHLEPAVAVILAAGKSTRMRSQIPKALHRVCGLPLTRHVIEACRQAGVQRIVVVIGHGAEQVRQGLGGDVEYVVQAEQLGTGHAALCAQPALRDHQGPILLLAGDVPLLKAETLQRLVAAARQPGIAGAMLVATMEDPTGYGRVLLDSAGYVQRIVEQKDASPEEATIKTWNPSVYCFKGLGLWERLSRVRADNAQKEYYLTDVVELTAADGERVIGVPVADAREVLGVNSRLDLAEVIRVMQERVLRDLMLSGVTIRDPHSTYVDVTVEVAPDTVIEPQTYLLGNTRVASDCVLGPMTVLQDCTVGEGCTIVMSHLEGSTVGRQVRIGPFSRVRPGCLIGDAVKIGDFVELKNAVVGEGVSAAHLSYLGDVEIGAHTNVGAGTITCNYDGFKKHRTTIGEGVFLGSDSILVAPVTIGDGAMTAAGSTITEDVPPNALAIGRVRQITKLEWATRWRNARRKRERMNG